MVGTFVAFHYQASPSYFYPLILQSDDPILFNGTNADDLKDPTRLGLIAAKEFKVASPLATVSKATVRVLWGCNL